MLDVIAWALKESASSQILIRGFQCCVQAPVTRHAKLFWCWWSSLRRLNVMPTSRWLSRHIEPQICINFWRYERCCAGQQPGPCLITRLEFYAQAKKQIRLISQNGPFMTCPQGGSCLNENRGETPPGASLLGSYLAQMAAIFHLKRDFWCPLVRCWLCKIRKIGPSLNFAH